jgi:PhnB protein
MYRIEAYVFFNGTCAAAMRFYEGVLNGKLVLVPVKGTEVADQMPPGRDEQILHSRLEAGGAILMGSDWMAPEPFPERGGSAVTITVPTTEEGKVIFDKLAEGGRVTMPYAKTFYSDGFGMLIDRFGVAWMVMAATNEG